MAVRGRSGWASRMERVPAGLPGPRGLRGEGVWSPSGKGGTVRRQRGEDSQPRDSFLRGEAAQATPSSRPELGAAVGNVFFHVISVQTLKGKRSQVCVPRQSEKDLHSKAQKKAERNKSSASRTQPKQSRSNQTQKVRHIGEEL